MSWLTDLLTYKKRFCCNKNAERQRFARKWNGVREVLDNRAGQEADTYILNIPQLPKFTQTVGKGVYLEWSTPTGYIELYLDGTDKKGDYLYSYPENVYHRPVSVDKVKELLLG